MVSFGDAFKYPFTNWKKLFYILWILVPIAGFFAYTGYVLKIYESAATKKKKELPEWGSFWENMKKGFIIFVIGIIFGIICFIVNMIPLIGIFISWLISAIKPLFFTNYAVKKEFEAAFDIKLVFGLVKKDIIGFFITWLKSVALTIIWLVITVITLFIGSVVTLPAMAYSVAFLWGSYYRETLT